MRNINKLARLACTTAILGTGCARRNDLDHTRKVDTSDHDTTTAHETTTAGRGPAPIAAELAEEYLQNPGFVADKWSPIVDVFAIPNEQGDLPFTGTPGEVQVVDPTGAKATNPDATTKHAYTARGLIIPNPEAFEEEEATRIRDGGDPGLESRGIWFQGSGYVRLKLHFGNQVVTVDGHVNSREFGGTVNGEHMTNIPAVIPFVQFANQNGETAITNGGPQVAIAPDFIEWEVTATEGDYFTFSVGGPDSFIDGDGPGDRDHQTHHIPIPHYSDTSHSPRFIVPTGEELISKRLQRQEVQADLDRKRKENRNTTKGTI
jgi:hypothetical protein